MADISLPLRAWPPDSAGQQSVSFLISRINAQRGSFRNITEDNLAEEAKSTTQDDSESGQEIKVLDSVEKPNGKADDIMIERQKLIELIAQAQQETSLTLDFISLLLSKDDPRHAATTISPFLKQTVPLGSLGAEMVKKSEVSDARVQEDSLVSMGWRLQSLNSAADSLLRSASRLEKQVTEETDYWDEVLAVQQQGWSVCRIPRERHTLGVRYGFSEAAPEFRDRGLGALRRSANGVYLDLGIRSSIPRRLRVRIQRDNESLACSTFTKDQHSAEKSVNREILQARNNIYDEELFHELNREARSFAGHDIRSSGGVIAIPMGNGQHIFVDMVSEEEPMPDVEGSQNGVADIIVIAFRILLSHAHRQTKNRRSNPPPPLTIQRPTRPLYPILWPILAFFQHHSAVENLRLFLGDLTTLLRKADVPLNVDASSSYAEMAKVTELFAQKNQNLADAFLKSLSSPLLSSITLTLPTTSPPQLTIEILTHHAGTQYKITVGTPQEGSPLADMSTSTTYTSTTDAQSHITHLLTLDLLVFIEQSSKGSKWQVSSPQNGQLSSDHGDRPSFQVLELKLTGESIELTWTKGRRPKGINAKAGSYFWSQDQGEGGRGLLEVAKRVREGLSV
ncbi:MAG: RNA polymerase II mediator complex subunit [Icmadophila ericetorum]|nr:RNA polymerase II mediator complex subunit [Icmadophila ericetorum]